MRQDALALWIDRAPGVGEWLIKRPAVMTVTIRVPGRRAGERPRTVRLRRSFGVTAPVEVRGVHRAGGLLFQDSVVADWEAVEGAGQTWSVEDLEGAIVCVRAAYQSFGSLTPRRSPRFHNLQLHFGQSTPFVLFFRESQLASPTICEPLPQDPDGTPATLALEYVFSLTSELLLEQLLTPRGAQALGLAGDANTSPTECRALRDHPLAARSLKPVACSL